MLTMLITIFQVILIFGICSCMRCLEISNLLQENVEDLGDKILVTINDNKNDYPGQFIVGSMFYQKIKKKIFL